MSVKCPKCGKEYDVALFQFQRAIICDKCGGLVSLEGVQPPPVEQEVPSLQKQVSPPSKFIIEVISIKGNCPVYSVGDKIVLDEGYRLNLKETTNVCMHSLVSIIPYYNALYYGVSPKSLGLAREDSSDEEVAYVQCLDPCTITGGGTVIFKIYRAPEH